MRIQQATDRVAWNTWLTQKMSNRKEPTSGGFLQSWQWGALQEREGRTILRLQAQNDDNINCGQALTIVYPLPLGQYYFYTPRGPVTENNDAETSLASAIQEQARKMRAVFWRFEPSLISSTEEKDRRIAITVQSSQPKKTLVLDLSNSEETLLSAMHEKTRYNIRLAQRKGIITQSVEIKNAIDFDPVWKLFTETAHRDKFHIHPRAHYEQLLAPTMPDDSRDFTARLFVASHNNEPLAVMIVIFFGGVATYLHGASSSQKRNLMAPHALHWHVIREAKQQGCRWYDFWGIADTAAWEGITRFKRGFGGFEIISPGAFELPLNHFWYTVYATAKKIKKHASVAQPG